MLRPSPATDALEPVREAPRGRLRIVVGLGNPGPRYAKTRHNVGFRAVDTLASRIGLTWQRDSIKVSSEVAAGLVDDLPLVLVRPQTFMNRSGDAVARVLEELQVPPSQALVIYDDMDLPLGAVRLRERGGAGTHNGMRSILASLGTEVIPRLRLGVGQAALRDAREFVLSPFDADEQPRADEMIARAADAALTWAKEGATVAMNRYNS